LQYASEELRADKKVVLTAVAVRKKGRRLQAASQDLRDNKQIVLAAVTNQSDALQYASKELQVDTSLKLALLAALTKEIWLFKYVPPELQGDPKIVLAVVRKDDGALQYVSKKLQVDDELKSTLLAALTRKRELFKYVPPEFQGDKNFVLAAVQNCAKALQYASTTCKENKKFYWQLSLNNLMIYNMQQKH